MSFSKLYHYIFGAISLLYPGHPYNTILLGALNFYVSFQKVTSEPLENCGFFDPQSFYWKSPYHTQNNLDYIQIEICQSQHSNKDEYFVAIVCALSCTYCQDKNNGSKSTDVGSPHITNTRSEERRVCDMI